MRDAAKVLNFDAAAIAQNAVAAATAPPDAKRPLYRDLPPAADYPITALGALRDAAEAIRFKTQAPIAICAQSVLAAAALVIAPHYDVKLLNGDTPLTIICLTIAESGERKSSVDNHALAPVYAKEERLRTDYEAQLKYFAADHAAWKAATEHAKKAAKKGRAAACEAIGEVGSEPKPPASPMLLMADATQEGIIMQLADRPWGGVFSAEGGLVLGGHGMSDDSKTRTAGLLNILWDGSPVRRRRVLTGAAFLPGRRCSMHLMVQPGVAEILTHDPAFADIGLTARMLIAAPASTAGTRLFRDAPPECADVLAGYKERLTRFLDKPHAMLDGSGSLDPFVLDLTPEARQMLIAFHDAVEQSIRPDGELSTIRGFASKMAEHAGRLAAVLAVYASPDVIEVDAESMGNGIELAQHYASEMKRLSDGASVAPDLKLARQLVEWWKARSDKKCHLLEIYQRGPNPLREAAKAKRIVAILEDHGWVKRLPPDTVLDGSPRRDSWELAP
jgi:hypothetical protein